MNLKWEITLVWTVVVAMTILAVSACTIESPSGRSVSVDGAALSGVIDSAGNAAARYRDACISNPECILHSE